MLAQPTPASVVLSSGSTWSTPPVLPLIGDQWATGGSAAAYTIFTDTTGAVLATIDGTIAPSQVTFTAAPALVDPIPAGANFEMFVTDPGGNPYKIRYGKVIRREATFTNSPAVTTTYQALAFTDTLQRTALGTNWTAITGTTQLNDNSGSSLPYGAGPPSVLLGTADSAIRWFQPLNTDSVSVNVNLLNVSGQGQTGVVLCCDVNMTTGLVAVFDSINNQVHTAILNAGPTAVTYEGTAVSNTVANGDNYTISYNNNTATLAIYKGTSTAPLGTWVDSSAVIPHGPGYRYTGLSFMNNFLSSGIEVSGWSAQDQV